MRRVLSIGLATLMLASSVAYAADGVAAKTTDETNFAGRGRHQMCFAGKIQGEAGKGFGMMNRGFGRNMEESCITDVLGDTVLTDAQKTKVETIKTNNTVIKGLREEIQVKQREIIGDTARTRGIAGNQKMGKGNLANLTDAQKEKINAIREKLQSINKPNVSEDSILNKQQGKFAMNADSNLTKEERAKKLLADVDNIITKQNAKITALREILADL
ncbi:MAG TPA: hypothetical protein DEP72_05125 [Clostridiales bacterium]|nr:MAG: hypothetical protein A2Y18_02275 [Clostridiales bacterium GWD2_32_19]HCC07523.1 hypothetical protein [Clostridiales bacterium]